MTLDGAEYSATSVFKSVGYDYGPQRAFKRETSGTWPWLSSDQAALPQTVHVRLPLNETVSGFSFRSSQFYPTSLSPTKFDFIGSNDCESWTVILQISGVRWSTKDEMKSWDIPIKERGSYSCYGFRFHRTPETHEAAIQDAKLYRG